MTPRQIFDSLVGKWNLQRTLGRHGVIHGTAAFNIGVQPNVLLYREDFIIKNLNQSLVHSYKEYEYHFDQAKIIKYFKQTSNESSIFYELEFIEDNFAVATHLCNQDNYKAEYRFYDYGKFKLKYCVKGPSKDYTIDTEFIKIS